MLIPKEEMKALADKMAISMALKGPGCLLENVMKEKQSKNPK